MITDIVVNNKYVLLYDGTTYKSGTLTTGNVTTPFTAEPYDTAQEMADRGLGLGLKCSEEEMIQLMEHGAVLPPDIMTYLHSVVWDMDIGLQERMIALGHTKPVP